MKTRECDMCHRQRSDHDMVHVLAPDLDEEGDAFCDWDCFGKFYARELPA